MYYYIILVLYIHTETYLINVISVSGFVVEIKYISCALMD